MTPRTIHIGASFAIVLVAYWTYALLAVPWIEPPPLPIETKSKDTSIVSSMPRPNDLADLFPPDRWELHDAKIINSDGKAMLLWQKYVNHSNGWVDLNPLTIIFMPDETITDTRERLRHAVVMEVPGGANLRFDRPLDLNKGGIGRLIEGRLRGPVKIRSLGKRPDHQDDLLVLTHDVDLSEQRITTANDVDFWWGPNSGRGRNMEIKLLPRLGPREAGQEGPNIGGIDQIRFEHVERLHLDMGSSSGSLAEGGATKPQPAAAAMPGSLSAHPAPIDITCRGPFCFHLIEQEPVATFRDQVDVLRIHPNGPSDRMSCELLSIFFVRATPPPGAPPAKQSAPGSDLKPARIEAQGTPTTINAPMDHLQARAERLQYNLQDQQLYLEDTQEVTLQKDHDEIHTPNLRYTPGPPGSTEQFQLLAGGPGWLRGEMADRPGQQLEAHWRQKLEVRPQDKNQVISLHGEARLNFQGMGRLDAQNIHFWLHQAPPDATGKSNLEPDRLLAEGNVVGDSEQFSINKVQQMEVWFSKAPPVPPPAAGYAVAGLPQPYVPSTMQGPALSPGQDLAGQASRLPGQNAGGTPAPQSAGSRKSHLEISGRLLRACVLLHDQPHGDPTRPQGDLTQQQGDLTEVAVFDNVKLRETQTETPGDRPLLVTGGTLYATEANSPQSKVTVTGEPAHMEGRGMSLTGPNIHIDRGANVLSMEGPGQMEKFLDRDLENRPLAQGGTLRINWQKSMLFDGRKAHFLDSVNVLSSSSLLQTGWLDVYFQKPISFSEKPASFSDARQPQQPLVEWIKCGDGVFVENRTIDAGQQQTSYDRMQLKNLELNNISGDFHGDGPGKLVSVRRGNAQGFAMPGGPLAGAVGPATVRPAGFGAQSFQQADPNQLTCIQLRFMKSITGNKIQNLIVFHGQVVAAYAPAQSWTTTLNSDDPKRLGPQAVVLHCDHLQVNRMSPVSGSSNGSMELAALDNVIAEGTNPAGTSFNTSSARLTYTQVKDLLILEGDGRSDADLYKQDVEGGEVTHITAQKIHYFPTTNKEVILDGVRTLDMNQVPGKRK